MQPLLHVQPFGALLAAGMVLGLLVSDRLARRGGLDRSLAAAAFVTAGIAAIVGARVVYAVGSPARESALELLALGRGGLSGYGALGVGSAVFAWGVSRRSDSAWAWLDTAAPGLLLAAAVTRLGCLLAGCDYGIPRAGGSLHPTPLYEGALLLALAIASVFLHRVRREHGQIFVGCVIAYALVRFSLEPLRGDPDRGVFRLLTLTQWWALASVLVTGVVWVRRVQRLPSST